MMPVWPDDDNADEIVMIMDNVEVYGWFGHDEGAFPHRQHPDHRTVFALATVVHRCLSIAAQAVASR